MSNVLFSYQDNVPNSTRNKRKKKLLINFDKNNSTYKLSRGIESAKTNFSTNTPQDLLRQKKNYVNQSNSTEYFSGYANYSNSQKKPKREFRPNWKYSYYLDKNDLFNFKNLHKNLEIKKTLCDYKDIDYKPKPIFYNWTKPKMIKILERNKDIEEEVKLHYWKYSHIFENKVIKPPGKLLKLIMTQLSNNYGGKNFLNNLNAKGNVDDGIFNDKLSVIRQWKVPGVYKNNKSNYEPIKIKRPKTSFEY